MKITSVRIKKGNNPLVLGIASVEFDNCFIIHDLRLIQLKDKRIISFPNKKVKKYLVSEDNISENYEYADIAHPSNKEFRQYIESELYKIYDSQISREVNSNE